MVVTPSPSGNSKLEVVSGLLEFTGMTECRTGMRWVSSFVEHHGDHPWALPRSQRLVDIWGLTGTSHVAELTSLHPNPSSRFSCLGKGLPLPPETPVILGSHTHTHTYVWLSSAALWPEDGGIVSATLADDTETSLLAPTVLPPAVFSGSHQ